VIGCGTVLEPAAANALPKPRNAVGSARPEQAPSPDIVNLVF
jgi:hypothetical protein